MTQFSFTLTIEGADVVAADAEEALFEAGCDDATFGVSCGVQTAEFDREAVESSVPGARVVNVHRGEAHQQTAHDR